jgi:four helix bundle protein
MAIIRSFRDLNVYKLARTESRRIFLATKSFPNDEKFSLTDQVRRSSRAVGAMIAEAWAKRRYPAAFISKIDDALGEAMETQAWLDHSLDAQYLTPSQHREFDAGWQSVGAMLNRMIERAADFCNPGQTP